jgi:cytidine deaminase
MSKQPVGSILNSKTKFIISGISIENYAQDEFLLSRFKEDTKLFIDEISGCLN